MNATNLGPLQFLEGTNKNEKTFVFYESTKIAKQVDGAYEKCSVLFAHMNMIYGVRANTIFRGSNESLMQSLTFRQISSSVWPFRADDVCLRSHVDT